jgi:hypothetical protein
MDANDDLILDRIIKILKEGVFWKDVIYCPFESGFLLNRLSIAQIERFIEALRTTDFFKVVAVPYDLSHETKETEYLKKRLGIDSSKGLSFIKQENGKEVLFISAALFRKRYITVYGRVSENVECVMTDDQRRRQ